ncbi:MAG: nucleotide exchange factor GrpE [Candidatus Micrarchaeia archaeon]
MEEPQSEKKKEENKEAEKKEESKEKEKKLVSESEYLELKDRLLRLAAEFDNYKKRIAKDVENSKQAGKAELMKKLLPTLDEFELALSVENKNDKTIRGFEMVYSNFLDTLKSEGLSEINTEGKYDPYKHEVMLVRESNEKEGTIIEIVRKGFMLNDILLRPASVIIAKSKENSEKGEIENKK